MQRWIILFIVNFLVVVSLAFVGMALLHFLKIDARLQHFTYYGILSFILGMGGAFFTLFSSRYFTKYYMHVQVISENTMYSDERKILDMVHSISRQAGLKIMPEVGIYPSSEANAFATGSSKKRSLVAVSSGIFQLSDGALEGIIGHEVSHIVNGDMVTMTLLEGSVRTLTIFFTYVLASFISGLFRKNDDRRHESNFFLRHLINMTLSFLGFLVMMRFSRRREYRADHGSAQLVGKEKMITALRELQGVGKYVAIEQDALHAFKVYSSKQGSILDSHPPISMRIKALMEMGI